MHGGSRLCRHPIRPQGRLGKHPEEVSEHLREREVTFAVGSLVRARGREWVVLPQSEPDLLMLRPLGGSEEEVTGIYVPLEPVEHARFALRSEERTSELQSWRLLRDALRLGFRSSAGP